jgi:hypothetical protein
MLEFASQTSPDNFAQDVHNSLVGIPNFPTGHTQSESERDPEIKVVDEEGHMLQADWPASKLYSPN